MSILDEKTSWDFWKTFPDVRHPFIVTEWNPHLLEEHLSISPDCHVLFTAHMHDLLPRFLERYPAAEERIFVPGDGAKEYVDTILGRVSGVKVLYPEKKYPRKLPQSRPMNFLVINELHPYGGLVPALSVIQELRESGKNLEVFEHQVPVREMFIPDRNWEIHNFPESAADITFAWRKAMGVRNPTPDFNPAESIVFYCPLHFTPPVSSVLWKCAAEGARIVTVKGPFTRGFSGEGILTYSPVLLEDFDPLQRPPGSHVNQALAEVIAREISPWI